MNNSNRNDFIEYLPLIIEVLKETNFLYYGDIKIKLRYSLIDYLNYTFIIKNEYIDKIMTQLCLGNCIRGFYPFKKINKNLNN